MRKNLFAGFIVFICLSLNVFAQQADAVSTILDTPLMTRAQAAYIAATWLDTGNESLSFEQAYTVLVQAGFWQDSAEPQSPVTLAELSGLCMKTWNIPGGLLYRIAKANRYAYRELKALNIIATTDDPGMTVSGFKGLNIMYSCMEYAEQSLRK